MPTPETHALLSASSAERWLHCTPSVRLTQGLPDTTSPYAEAGRLAHAIAELRLRKLFLESMGPKTFAARLNKLKKDPAFDPEMLHTTEEYADFVHEQALAFPARPYVAVEQRVDFSSFVPDGFGTADCILIGSNVLHVIDYKHGQGHPVEAEENPQLKLYALGALMRYYQLYTIETVRISIVQPRAGGIKTWETAKDALIDWGVQTVRPLAKKAFVGEGEQIPGTWCTFCKLKGNCRARGQHLALEAFGQKPAPTYSLQELGDILQRARGLATWVKDLEDYALQAELSGQDIPGWKAVEGRSVRQFDDPSAALADLLAAGYDEALFYERKPLTLAQIEKVLGKKAFQEAAGGHIVTPPGKPTLVPESDKRQPINAAANAFTNT